jgi:hypothetical protein
MIITTENFTSPPKNKATAVAVFDLVNSQKYITFLWKQIRGRRWSHADYKKVGIEIETKAGRTDISFILSLSPNKIVSYSGASEGYSASLHSCIIDHSEVKDFDNFLAEFVEKFDLIEFTGD